MDTPVISYIRFSSKIQQKGNSQARQLQAAKNYCKRNGLTLSDRYLDLGVSAYRQKNIKEGALARFLALVKAGEVPKGAILLVEELDRISRASPGKAVELFLSLVNSGITVVTLADECVYNEKNIDQLEKLMISVLRLCAAHAESDKKAMRLAAAWANKRKLATEENKPITARLPQWLTLDKKSKTIVVNEFAAVVKRIFELVDKLDYGTTRIAKTINSEFELTKPLITSYIKKILHNPAVMGIYQPCKTTYDVDNKRKQVAAGNPIDNYYPAVITPQQYYRVQSIITGRGGRARESKGYVNILQGLLYSPEGHYMGTQNKGYGRCYADSVKIRQGDSATTYPCIALDTAVLFFLKKEALAAISNKPEPKEDTSGLEQNIAQTEVKLMQLKKAAAEHADITSIIDSMIAAEQKLKKLRAELAQTQAKDSRDITNAVARLLDLQIALTDQEQRSKIKAALKRIVDRITVSISRNGVICSADISIRLFNGSEWAFKANCHRNFAELVEVAIDKLRRVDDTQRKKLVTCKAYINYSNAQRRVSGLQNIQTRARVLELKEEGKTAAQIAKELRLCVTSVYKII